MRRPGPRTWSIRARTALTFAAATAALAGGVLVFVALASQASLVRSVGDDAQVVVPGGATTSAASRPPEPGRRSTVAPDPSAAVGTGEDRLAVAIVQQASTLQWQWSAIGVAGAAALAGVVGWLLSRRVLAPIDRITAAANRISAENLHERIDLDGPDDELRRLSRTVDALLDRLETAFESQRRFVAQASHELRTPIAVQRAAIQIGLGDDAGPDEIAATRAQLLEHTRRSEHLVEGLLVLAQADRGLDDRLVQLDLPALVQEVVAGAAAHAEAAGVDLRCSVGERGTPAGAPVVGDPVLVRQVVLNLVENAVEYNVPGGSVRVHVDGDGHGLEVENTGPVVPPDVVDTLVEPFRRHGDGGTRRHSGLGLSIVAAVVRAHGWRLSLRPRQRGGLRARVDVSSVQPRDDRD